MVTPDQKPLTNFETAVLGPANVQLYSFWRETRNIIEQETMSGLVSLAHNWFFERKEQSLKYERLNISK